MMSRFQAEILSGLAEGEEVIIGTRQKNEERPPSKGSSALSHPPAAARKP